MFVSCYIAENYWSGFLFFPSIVMHHNASKSKNRCYTTNFGIFNQQDKLRHVFKYSIWFNINHMNQKYFFLFSSLIEPIKSFRSGGLNRVGHVTGNKHIFFFLPDYNFKYNNAKRSIPAHSTFVNDTHHDLHP